MLKKEANLKELQAVLDASPFTYRVRIENENRNYTIEIFEDLPFESNQWVQIANLHLNSDMENTWLFQSPAYRKNDPKAYEAIFKFLMSVEDSEVIANDYAND